MKLKIILTSLGPADFKELKLFLQSPFFNTDPNLLRFYDALSKQFPITHLTRSDRGKLFKQVFPKHEWDDAKWRNLVAKMVKSLEQFLAAQEMKANSGLEGQKLLAIAYNRRNLYDLFEKQTRSLETALSAISHTDQNALLDRMQVSQSFYYHPMTNKLENFRHLVSAKNHAEDFFKAQQLKIACEALVHGHILKEGAGAKVAPPPLPIYYRLYQAVHTFLEDGSDVSFQNAKSFFDKVVGQLSMADKKFGLLHLINFAVKQNNMGKGEYQNTMFELYEQGLEQKILLENGLLSPVTFQNILALCGILHKSEWAENFIEKYERFLPSNTRETGKTMGLANLHFNQKDFSKVIDLLIAFSPNDLTDLLIAKTMLLRSYFEYFLQDRSYYELLLNYAHAFESLVKRKKSLPEERRIGCIHLSTILRKIVKHILENNWDAETKSNFLEIVVSTNPLIGKNWLLEKIKNM